MIFLHVRERTLFMAEDCKDLIKIRISDCRWVCWQQLPPPMAAVAQICEPRRGRWLFPWQLGDLWDPSWKWNTCSTFTYVQEVFWGGTSSVQCRRSLSWNRWKNNEENYHMCLPSIYKMCRVLLPTSPPVTTAGETQINNHAGPTI